MTILIIILILSPFLAVFVAAAMGLNKNSVDPTGQTPTEEQ